MHAQLEHWHMRPVVAAKREKAELPEGWKDSVSLHLVSSRVEQKTTLPDDVLDRAAVLFSAAQKRFAQMEPPRAGAAAGD